MIWLRLVITVIALLGVVYYLMLVIQLLSNGNFRITNRKLTFSRGIVPFYYWIAPQNEAPKPSKSGKGSGNAQTLEERVNEREDIRNEKERQTLQN